MKIVKKIGGLKKNRIFAAIQSEKFGTRMSRPQTCKASVLSKRK